MTNNFQKALGFTLAFEGGYSNNPNDSGGATMHGITARVYDAHRTSKSLPVQSVKYISESEVSDIYYNGYWLKNHCDVLPEGIDIAVFDFGVNAGSEAMKELQQVCGVTADGIFGAQTKASVISACANDSKGTINKYLTAHEVFYKNLTVKYPKNIHFLNGWINRTEKLRTLLT